MTRFATTVTLVVLFVPNLMRAQGPVYFADANLKAAVEAELGISNPTPTDMLGLTHALRAGNQGISDLTGLEYALNLWGLELNHNQISDISALSGLSLDYLQLHNNHISDISPILGQYQSVSLDSNPLNEEAYCSLLYRIDTLFDESLFYSPNPNPPKNVAASQGTYADHVRITWDQVCNGPNYTTYYRVIRGQYNDPMESISSWLTETQFSDTTAVPGVEYDYWIEAAASSDGSFGLTAYGNPAQGWCEPAPVPVIAVNTTSLAATCTQGDNAPGVSFEVWNSGTGTLNYGIGDNANWLAVSPEGGSSTGEHEAHTVTYNTSALVVGNYTGTISITAPGATNSPQTITVNLTVEEPANLPPTAEAGAPQTHTDTNRDGSESVTLSGSGTDPDGTIVRYVWTEGATQRATGPSPAISLNVGAHTLTLTVTDDDGATGSDTVQITISEPDNLPPTAEAGPRQAHTDTNRDGSESVTLAGSGTDPDGTIVSYVWTEGTTQHATVASPTLSLGVGVHTLTLTVTDDDGATGSDTVQITILAPAQSNLHDPGDGHRFSPEKFTIGEADQWITIGAMIGNDGEARSGEVAVDFYISPAPSPYNSGRIHLGTEYIRNGVEPGDDNHVLCEGRFRFPHDSVTDENHDYYVCWLFSTDPGTDRSPDNNKGGIWDDPLTVGPPEFTFSLEISAKYGGTIVDPDKGEGTYVYTETADIPITAEARPKFDFVGWTGSAAGLVRQPRLAGTAVDLSSLEGEPTGVYTLEANFELAEVGQDKKVYIKPTAPSGQGGNGSINSHIVGLQYGDGSINSPIPGLQNGWDVAPSGVTVVAQRGLYKESLALQGKDVTIIGSWLDDQDTRLHSLALDRADTTDKGRVLMGMANAIVPDYLSMPVLDGNGIGPVLRFGGGAQANCRVSGFIITGGSADTGAAIDCNGTSPEISHCVISGNLVTEDAGACLQFVDSNAVLTNCTIAGNFGVPGSSLMSFTDSEVVIANSIVWDNDPWVIHAEPDSVPSIFYCDIEGAWPGLGNFTADPLFVLPGHWDNAGTPHDPTDDVWVLGDYHLQSARGRFFEDLAVWTLDAQSSPCIDAGDPDVGSGSEPIPHGKRMNIGVYGGTDQASMTPPRLQ